MIIVVITSLLLQQAGLTPVVASLPQLQQQYGSLSQALDTTRHQIPTKGVYIPDDEDQHQGQKACDKQSNKTLSAH